MRSCSLVLRCSSATPFEGILTRPTNLPNGQEPESTEAEATAVRAKIPNVAAKLYLVDGMSHIYRAYYAIQALTNKQGLPTNAVYGFTNMLRKLISEEKPDYLGVAIDLFGPTIRHEQYEDYKSTRPPMPEDLVEQVPYILRVCEVLRVPVLSCERYEADDVIGTLARKAVARGLEVVIVSIDKDMFQLVNDYIRILDTRNMSRLDAAKVKEKLGVSPEQVIDVLSLVGDTSDNIPGAPGIGEKGARQLIQEYGTLQNLFAHRDQVARKTYRESLERHEDQIWQSHELLRIHEDLSVELDLKELELSEPDRESARELFTQLDFGTIVQDFLPIGQAPEVHYEPVNSPEDLRALSQRLQGQLASLAPRFAPDNDLEAPLQGMALTDQAHQAWSLPPQLWEESPDEMAVLLKAPKKWIIHDLKPLYFFMEQYPWLRKGDFLDTMLMAYLLNPNQSNFSLAKLGQEYLQHRLDSSTEESGLFNGEVADLLCEQADLTLQLFSVLHPRVQEKKLEKLLYEIEIPLVEVLASMEKQGVRVDCALLQQMSQQMEGEIEALTQKIYEIAGEEFNINSPRQLATVLFDQLNLPQPKRTRKAGHFATGVEVLEELAASYGIARLILDFRELTKLKNTYLDALPKLVNPRTGRIHTSYNQMVAATGRLSSSNPNLQNIPIRSESGRKIRQAFIPGSDCQILAADYSQIELRVMAHLSEDPVLVEAFLKGEDIHERTARQVFGMNAVMNPAEFRRQAKVINFGVMYGLSAFGLAQNLKIERKEAQQFIEDYFQQYKGVKNWIDRTLQEALEKGYVTTLFGRIRQIPEIGSRNWNLRNFGERTAINAPIQGTAADLIKKAMLSMHSEMSRQKMKSKLIMQVHDELVFEVEETEIEPMKRLVTQKMEGVAELKVPLKVDVGVGLSWFDTKPGR